MSLLDRFTNWVRSLFGVEAADEPDTDEDATEPSEPESEPRLDPNGVTEVRKQSDDDPIDRLREVKREQRDSDTAGGEIGADGDSGENDDGSALSR